MCLSYQSLGHAKNQVTSEFVNESKDPLTTENTKFHEQMQT